MVEHNNANNRNLLVMVTCSNSNNANRVIGVIGSSPVSPTISLQVFRPPFETGSIKLYKGYNARILKKRLKKMSKTFGGYKKNS